MGMNFLFALNSGETRGHENNKFSRLLFCPTADESAGCLSSFELSSRDTSQDVVSQRVDFSCKT